MKHILISTIEAAKSNDIAAAEQIQAHFKGYIIDKSLQRGFDPNGKPITYIDEDIRYFAETALLAAIFTFQFREPPDDFEP